MSVMNPNQGSFMSPHQGQTRYANGPTLAPGTQASDYVWDPESAQWALKSDARPGYIYVRDPSLSKNHQTGWIPTADYNGGHTGLFHGWTKGQLLALAGIGGAALAGPVASAFSSGGNAAAAGGAAASGAGSAVPDLAVTSGLGATVPGTAIGVGGGAGMGGTLASTSLAGSAALPVAGSGSVPALAGGGGAAGTAASTAARGAGMFGVKDAIQAAPLVASLFSRGGGGNGVPPQNDLLNQLIQMQMRQVQQAQPLRDAVLKMAMGLMPIAYQQNFPTVTGGR